MNGYNRTILMGTVGADAELRILEGGNAVASMNIAVNESYVDASGVRQTKTQWFKIEGWKKTAEFMGNYCKKGTALLVEGRLKNESYDKDGVTVYVTKVVANSIDFAGSKSTTAPQTNAAPVAQSAPQANTAPVAPQAAPVAQVAPQANVAPVVQAQQQTEQYVGSGEFVQGMNNSADDDLPF